jgi:hypothetical protein
MIFFLWTIIVNDAIRDSSCILSFPRLGSNSYIKQVLIPAPLNSINNVNVNTKTCLLNSRRHPRLYPSIHLSKP